MSSFWDEDRNELSPVVIDGAEIIAGSRVRLQPRSGRDIFDLVLAGKTAIVEAIEQDYEGNVQLAVTIEDDPGRDLGELRQPGHRFFFSTAEVEPVVEAGEPPAGYAEGSS